MCKGVSIQSCIRNILNELEHRITKDIIEEQRKRNKKIMDKKRNKSNGIRPDEKDSINSI